MRFKTLESSNIAGVSYSKKHKVLIVDFHSGKRYAYQGVPFGLYCKLLKADSHGTFFNLNIKDEFNYQRVDTEDTVSEEPSLVDALQRSLEEILKHK